MEGLNIVDTKILTLLGDPLAPNFFFREFDLGKV